VLEARTLFHYIKCTHWRTQTQELDYELY